MLEKARGLKLHVTYSMQNLLLHVCSVFYLATNTNGKLGDFFYHLFSVIYASLFLAVRFVVTFERLANTLQLLKIIHRFRYPGSKIPFSEYNEVKKPLVQKKGDLPLNVT